MNSFIAFFIQRLYYFLHNIISSLAQVQTLDLQCTYRVSSIGHNSGIVRYQRNAGIDPETTDLCRITDDSVSLLLSSVIEASFLS